MKKLQRVQPRQMTLEEMGFQEGWGNDKYTIWVRHITNPFFGSGKHLSVKRNDREPIHDWRDLQEIKNMICGESWEGVELYPAEDRLLDEANQYHLWCFPLRLPIGDNNGRRVATPEEAKRVGAKQRKFGK